MYRKWKSQIEKVWVGQTEPFGKNTNEIYVWWWHAFLCAVNNIRRARTKMYHPVLGCDIQNLSLPYHTIPYRTACINLNSCSQKANWTNERQRKIEEGERGRNEKQAKLNRDNTIDSCAFYLRWQNFNGVRIYML